MSPARARPSGGEPAHDTDALARLRDYRDRRTHRLVGLMSGTSADGIDAVLVRIEGMGLDARVETLAHRATPFDTDLRGAILEVASAPQVSLERLLRLDAALGEAYAVSAIGVLEAEGAGRGAVDAIGMHGQTVRHMPRQVGAEAMTLQIGSAAIVAERTGIAVVSDFRRRDTAAGGEGAPLVPLADWWLFRSASESRVLLNLGGMANLTYLPRGAELADVLAFDTGPGNAVLDVLAAIASGGTRRRDEGGESAARGRPSEALLAELLADPFFAQPPPRSTGRERFGEDYAGKLRVAGLALGLSEDDVIATAAALSVASVADAIERFVRPRGTVDRVLVSGGGVRNAALMRGLAARLRPTPVEPLESLGVVAEAKEALAFALLAHRTLSGAPGNVPAATGAAHPVVLGQITPGRIP